MIRKIKGLRDIITHNTLSRSRSQAKKRPRILEDGWDGDCRKHLYKKNNGNGDEKSHLINERVYFEKIIQRNINFLEEEILNLKPFAERDTLGAKEALAQFQEKKTELEKIRAEYLNQFKT